MYTDEKHFPLRTLIKVCIRGSEVKGDCSGLELRYDSCKVMSGMRSGNSIPGEKWATTTKLLCEKWNDILELSRA